MARTLEQLIASQRYHDHEAENYRRSALAEREENGDTLLAEEFEGIEQLHRKWAAEDEDAITDLEIEMAGV